MDLYTNIRIELESDSAFECISCQENNITDDSIYILPCLHQICSTCLNDIDKDVKLKKSKYKCVECHEQFDFQYIKTKKYTNNFFKIKGSKIKNSLSKEEISINKKFINNLIKSTLDIMHDIDFIIMDFTFQRMTIEDNYQNMFNIEDFEFFFPDLIEQIFIKRDFLLKVDLKTIDLEIENIRSISERYDKFVAVLKCINVNMHLDKITEIVNYFNPNVNGQININNIVKDSSVKKKYFNSTLNDIVSKEFGYYIYTNNSNQLTIANMTFNDQKFINYMASPTLKYGSSPMNHSDGLVVLGPLSDPNVLVKLKNYIHNSIIHLIININQDIKFAKELGILDNITYLTIGHSFNQDIRDCIPNSVTHLSFSGCFNHNIKGCIPNSVTNLTFNEYFDRDIKDCIPDSVITLTIGFNRTIKNCIPNSVKQLIFNNNFNQDIKDSIPNSVTHITFGHCFNQSIKDCIPNSVTHLIFGFAFNQDIKDCIPNSVTHLVFGTEFKKDIKDCIPNSVKHLVLGNCRDQDLRNCIPNSVTHLKFNEYFNQSIKDCIPNSVTHLTLSYYFNQDIKGCIPYGVTHLIFGQCFNQDIKDCIPNSVTHLTFGFAFNQNIKDCLPDSITHLTVGHNFGQGQENNFEDCLPSSLQCIKLIDNKFIIVSKIPQNIKIIIT
jgi:hypothetical protein